MGKSVVVYAIGRTFEYEGDNVDCGVAPHGLVVAETVPDVTGQSDDGTKQRILAQFKTWDAVEVT